MKFQFGVEIEAYSETMDHRNLAELLEVERGVKRDSSSHDSLDWGIYFDRSIKHKSKDVYPIELVSPVMQGASALEEIRSLLNQAKDLANLRINSTCSIHIHVGVESMYKVLIGNEKPTIDDQIAQIVEPFFKVFSEHYEDELLAMMPPSRRESRYCNSIKSVSFNVDMSKYYTLAYRPRINTLEFRLHSGTLSFTKIANWIAIIELVCENFLEDMHADKPSIFNLLYGPLLSYYNGRVKKFQTTM